MAEPPSDLTSRPANQLAPPVLPLFRADRPRPGRADVVVRPSPAPAAPHPSLVLLTEPRGPAAARLRALRHRLVERGDPHTVLVTSPSPAEGKSFVAANLALALAELGKYRVLLLEANLRSPALAARFGLEGPNPPCFLAQVEAHRNQPDLPWEVAGIGAGDLHLLAIRRAAPGVTLDAPSFASVVDRLRQSYDYLIVDGPPVLRGPDAQLLEDAVDALLVVARAGATRGRALRAAFEQLLPADLLGVVLLEAKR